MVRKLEQMNIDSVEHAAKKKSAEVAKLRGAQK